MSLFWRHIFWFISFHVVLLFCCFFCFFVVIRFDCKSVWRRKKYKIVFGWVWKGNTNDKESHKQSQRKQNQIRKTNIRNIKCRARLIKRLCFIFFDILLWLLLSRAWRRPRRTSSSRNFCFLSEFTREIKCSKLWMRELMWIRCQMGVIIQHYAFRICLLSLIHSLAHFFTCSTSL